MSKLVVEAIENAAGNNPLSVLMTENTSTGTTTIDFTGIPSGVTKVHVMFDSFSMSGTSNTIVQIGDAGGIETSGYVGCVSRDSAASTAFSDGIKLENEGSGGIIIQGSITFILMNASSNKWVAEGVIASSNNIADFMTAGTKSLSGELDRVRVTSGGGSETVDANSGVNVRYDY